MYVYIYIYIEIVLSKNTFSKFHSQKVHFIFNIASLKNIFKTTLGKKTFLKLLFHKRHFQNCSLKNNFFEICFSKRPFLTD